MSALCDCYLAKQIFFFFFLQQTVSAKHINKAKEYHSKTKNMAANPQKQQLIMKHNQKKKKQQQKIKKHNHKTKNMTANSEAKQQYQKDNRKFKRTSTLTQNRKSRSLSHALSWLATAYVRLGDWGKWRAGAYL